MNHDSDAKGTTISVPTSSHTLTGMCTNRIVWIIVPWHLAVVETTVRSSCSSSSSNSSSHGSSSCC